MIRIKADRCGYDKYKCVGIPQISEDSNGMFDENVAIVASMKAEFNKLPMRIKGMVFSEDTTNMSWPDGGPHPEVPELTCRTNTDPLSDETDVSVHPECLDIVIAGHTYQYPVYGGTSGWADLFNAEYQHGEDPRYFYRNTIVGSTNAVASDVFIITGDTHWHNIYSLGGTRSGYNGVPNFTVNITDTMENSVEMGPGLLEPMLDTDFDPVDISTIPAWEAGDDSFTLSNILINGWKGVVDDRFRNIYARLNSIPISDADRKLRSLTGAQNTESECKNFQITLTSGAALRDPDDVDQRTYHADTLPNADNTHTPITVGSRWHGKTVTSLWQAFNGVWWWTVEDAPNLYAVSGGSIIYGTSTISVAGLSDLYAPFYAYLMASFDVPTSHTDVKAADVPRVPGEGGTPRMIEDGDVVASGGTVTNFTSTGSGAATRYSWDTIGDNTAEIAVKTGPQLSEDGTADPEPGGVGIGGVRIIQGADSSDPLILYKIYHEDCISEIEKPEADAEAALHGVIDFDIYGNEIITPLPGSTITPAPGIVQPVVNIALVIDGSTETNYHSTTDVPTVESVYNFIHGITAYNGPVADAKATEIALSGISGSTVLGEPVDYVIPINKDRWAQNTEDEISGYTAAESMYEAAKAAWELAGEPEEGEIYEAYIEASTAYSDAYYTVYGDVSDGEPGTTYVINSIVLMNGAMMGVAATTAPSVKAVYDFVHDIYALSTTGTILVNEQNVPYVSHGTPGTVFTIDSLDKARYEAEEYYQDEVPTVKAVMDYVKMEGSTSSIIGIIGYTTNQPEVLWPIPGSTVDPAAGYVQNVRNVYVSGTHGVSGYAVPTVDAVYNFIHNVAVEGMTFSSALVTGGTLAEISTTEGDVTTITGYTATGEPGTCYMATLIPVGSTVSIDIDNCAPTVQAVIDYVDDMLPVDAVAGTLVNGSTTEVWAEGDQYVDPVRGTVEVSSQIVVGSTPGLSLQTVPSVKATYAFVHNESLDIAYRSLATGGTVSNAFGPTYMATKTPANTPSYRKWNKSSKEQNLLGTNASVTGWTPGTINVIDTIVFVQANVFLVEGDVSITVPSIKAVYDFVHNAYALAEPGTVKVMSGTTTRYVAHGTPGTVYSVDTIDIDVYNAGAYNPGSAAGYSNNGSYWYEEVPTVRAVIQYVEGRSCPSAIKGIISVSAGTESLVSVQGTTAAAGIVQPVKNIDIGTQDPNNVSPDAVPTVQAVYDFIHGYTVANYKVADAKATADETIAVAGSTVQVKCGTSAVPGTFYVTNDMANITDTVTTYVAPEAVPTAMSVVNYIRAYVAGHTATASRISVSDDSPYESLDAIHTTGTVDVSRCINLNLTVNKRPESSRVVPTVEAVYNFVHDLTDFYSGSTMSAQSSLATRGIITGTTTGTSPVITGATASGCTVGTYKVVSNIVGATNAQGGLFSVDDVVPTADAIVKYIKSLNLDPAGMAVSGNLNQNGDWVTAATVSAGIYYVATNVVAGTAGSAAYSSVPTVRAVNDFIAGYTASVGGFSVTAADKEDWETVGTGTSATKRKADLGIVGVVDTLVAATTVSNRSLSTNTVPTVAAVKDYVDIHTPDMAVSGSLNQNGDWVTASIVSAGIYYVATNVVGGTANSPAYSSVPTVHSVHDFVTGYTASVGGFSVTNTGAEDWVTTGTGASATKREAKPGLVGVVDTLVAATTISYRSLSIKTVPTVAAVKDYVDTQSRIDAIPGKLYINTGTSAGEAIADVRGTTHTEGIIQSVTNVFEDTNATNPPLSVKVVPTVEAVINFMHNYDLAEDPTPTLGPVTRAIATEGTIAVSGQTAAKLSGIDASTNAIPGTCYTVISMLNMRNRTLVKTSGYTVGSTSYTVASIVPTVEAVAEYVANSTASIGGFTTSGSTEEWISGYTAVAGMFKVVSTLNAAAVTDSRPYSTDTVPTVAAVKDYVDSNKGAQYEGQFKVYKATSAATKWTIDPGTVYYPGGSKDILSNSTAVSVTTAAQTIWLKIYRTAESATIQYEYSTAYARDIYSQSIPIAYVIGSTVSQYQHGPAIIEGRWE